MRTGRQTDRQTNVPKLIIAFRSFLKVSHNENKSKTNGFRFAIVAGKVAYYGEVL